MKLRINHKYILSSEYVDSHYAGQEVVLTRIGHDFDGTMRCFIRFVNTKKFGAHEFNCGDYCLLPITCIDVSNLL